MAATLIPLEHRTYSQVWGSECTHFQGNIFLPTTHEAIPRISFNWTKLFRERHEKCSVRYLIDTREIMK
jgi:hypothetical protein